jgi:hypothetical protein
MKVTLMLADFAQVAENKLYILGGGWSQIGPGPATFAVAGKIEVPWDRGNDKHAFRLELVDADGQPVAFPVPGDDPDEGVIFGGEFETGRPPGLKPGTPLDFVFACNFVAMPLEPGGRYEWRLSIDNATEDGWRLGFNTRPPLSPAQAATG